jgi:hypothetical protein
MIKVIYKHWTKGHILEIVGTMPKELNNGSSERLVVKLQDGSYSDILKSTVVRIESISRL